MLSSKSTQALKENNLKTEKMRIYGTSTENPFGGQQEAAKCYPVQSGWLQISGHYRCVAQSTSSPMHEKGFNHLSISIQPVNLLDGREHQNALEAT